MRPLLDILCSKSPTLCSKGEIIVGTGVGVGVDDLVDKSAGKVCASITGGNIARNNQAKKGRTVARRKANIVFLSFQYFDSLTLRSNKHEISVCI